MTYKEFVKKYNNKYTDYDGYFGCQCWDLAQRYNTEVLKVPASVLSGCGLVSNMLKEPKRSVLLKYFTEVTTAQQGDIAIWEHGHIAIVDSKNYYFSQNPNPCKVIKITRGGVHFFRLKSKSSSSTSSKYYKKYTGKSVSIVDALKSIGADSSFNNRRAIAKANGISNYIGSSSQNTKMLNLLKQGKLIKRP
jgi:hypothetical protein